MIGRCDSVDGTWLGCTLRKNAGDLYGMCVHFLPSDCIMNKCLYTTHRMVVISLSFSPIPWFSVIFN